MRLGVWLWLVGSATAQTVPPAPAVAEPPPDPAASCKEQTATATGRTWFCGAATITMSEVPAASLTQAEASARDSALTLVGRVYRVSRGTFQIEGKDLAFELYSREQGPPLTVFTLAGDGPTGTRLVNCVMPERGQPAIDACSYLSSVVVRDGKF